MQLSALLLLLPLATAQITGVSGPNSNKGMQPEIIAPPSSVTDNSQTNRRQQGFDEKQNYITQQAFNVDGGGAIPSGTCVNSHMIFLNAPTNIGQVSHLNVVWTFSTPILGTMSDSAGNLESASNPFLGAPATTYPSSFAARGLEGGEVPVYTVGGTTVKVSMTVSQPGDWMRVVTECAGVEDDPHFTGFDGSKYDFQGEPGSYWNIITDRDFQLNAYFMESPTDHKTYMGRLGFMVDGNKILISTGFVLLNDKVVSGFEHLTNASGESVGFIRVHLTRGIRIRTKAFEFHVSTEKQSGFEYLNIETSITSTGLCNPHGILGQTARYLVTGDEPKPVHLSHHNKYASGLIEGKPTDYLVADGIYGTKFTFNRYGTPFEQLKSVEVRHSFATAIYLGEN